ncbi:MAG TPA: RsmD family RNA methyltransferase [Gillisia sp.]|nr:RsmD family RNA methyltransferase [Gillisia sp.]
MRIISGRHKGKKITAPKKLPIRPTTDFAKEALFNILNNRFHFNELVVVDLFSGSGNIAYEFGSRGAGPITAVDENVECVKFITKISGELDLDITAIKSDVFKYLEKAPVKADVIFADPPYDFDVDALSRLVATTFEKDLLQEEGALIIEHTKRIDLSHLDHFKELRKYGNSVFSFFS